jgi:hypothetical protein
MIIVAGPPGSGKSSRFPLSRFGVGWFNADDRAAELNLGSFHKIPAEIRSRVNVEFQRWILDHITTHQGFAIETTLRSPITFEQAQPTSSSFRNSYACSSRAMLVGAGWSSVGAKTRIGQDAPALALLDRRNSPSFHKVSEPELDSCAIDKIVSHFGLRC